MKPSSLSTCARCCFKCVEGISTAGDSMRLALRMRVSMSAIGSVIMAGILSSLPGLLAFAERHPEHSQQFACLIIALGAGDERDVHPLREVGLVGIDLGKHQL